MVLVRSESGQLLMIHQQALAQMQAQAAAAPRPATPTAMPLAQVWSPMAQWAGGAAFPYASVTLEGFIGSGKKNRLST